MNIFRFKEVVLCYAIYDTNNEIDFLSPSCLQKISVLEILVNRWIPKENRDSMLQPTQNLPLDASKHGASSIQGYFESFDHLDD